ncbi:endoribonuclease SymE [Erwinia pyrifoliae]|uniref:endoribonuclease SymE n=1 Tax=Erwinia pyrifoliae TaxID=79967 RepID=UPI00019613E5|nr:endoribonuclease SymE [Erwinia pyrifoliae]AUX71693.1 endoribonuclease SymE [Erwinia pyrifoliae]MCA8878080.1 endoribonuclease SymE [Erwinia pyrifoliae]CAX56682.1 Endoribonuclease [Erwinia pyrifoliae Ep1/96]
MAETHHKPETRTPTTSRSYTVGYVRDSGTFEPFPAVTLKGGWLREAGFDTGTAVNVRVLPDCLILTVKPPSAEPEIMQALRQVCGKLSARKQRQIEEFIQVIAGPQKRQG